MQTCATFSIHDHRNPLFRQALALFDCIVVPIPSKPIGGLTADELAQLKSDVEYLEKNDAAQAFEWREEEFLDWRSPHLADAAALGINRDAFFDTRLMICEDLQKRLGREDVQAVPVYGSPEQYLAAHSDLLKAGMSLTAEILQRLPVPSSDTPLQDLIQLRSKPAFRTALADLLEWKRATLPAIVLAPERMSAIEAAMRDFDKLTRQYAEAMESEGYKKAATIGSIFFSMATGDIVGAVKEGLVSYRELCEPRWQQLSQMKCAPGALVYHFKSELG